MSNVVVLGDYLWRCGALNQTKMEHLLAYRGIGHMGFIILGVGVAI